MKKNPKNNCQEALDLLQTKMEQEHFTEAELENLCQEFPDCSPQIRSTYAVWQDLEELAVPEPSRAIRSNFYQMLDEMESETANAKPNFRFNWWTWNGLSLKWAVIGGVFILGMLSGTFFRPMDKQVEAVALGAQTAYEENFAKLTSSSATDRLQAIQMAKQMEVLDDKIVEALNQTLIHDKNVNVRLSSIETMLYFLDNPKVRENLIRAIPYQTSPLIQLTLAEVVTALNDKRAIEEIQRLMQTEQLEVEVKLKLEDTIETLL